MSNQLTTKEPLVLVSKQAGVTVIPSDTLLTRLNYFDGKFLRADDLRAEQQYLRHLVQFSNQAGGHGVAHGYNVALSAGGDTLNVGPGLAIDPAGRVLLLPHMVSIGVQQLIDQSQELLKIVKAMKAGNGGGFADCEFVAGEPPTNSPQAGDLYLITVSHAEAYCGQEDVYGKLCEEACVTSTDRPFIVEGVVLRALPLTLQTPLAQSSAVFLTQQHLRSRVASAYFNDERLRIPDLISKAGLESTVWCFGAEAATGSDVPIAVVARAGATTLFLDAWTARRERIDPQARRYWQWRMRMRPWDVFLAHVLQFQCQLAELFKTAPDPGADDPCLNERQVIAETAGLIAQLNTIFAESSAKLADLNLDPIAVKTALGLTDENLAKYADIQKKLDAVKESDFTGKLERVLINGGIVEMPSAGYLPVVPSSTISINKQVRALVGEGLDLRFCIVRPDYPAHALEEAQHMERISLLQGLDDPNNKPEVDILVPDGEIITSEQAALLGGFEAGVTFAPPLHEFLSIFFTGDPDFLDFPFNSTAVSTTNLPPLPFKGAARVERLESGGGALYLSTRAEIDIIAPSIIVEDVVVTPVVAQAAEEPEKAATPKGKKAAAKGKAAAKQPDAKQTESRPADLYSRFKLAAIRSLANYAARGKARGQQPAPARMILPQDETPGGAAPAATQKANAGLWFAMKSEANIFALKQNESAPLLLRGILAAPAQGQQNYIDARLQGELEVTETQDLAGERVVKGTLKVMSSLDVKLGSESENIPRVVNFDVEARLLTGTQGHIVKLSIKHQGKVSGFDIVINIAKDPLKAQATVKFKHGGSNFEGTMLESTLLSNPAVFEPTNAAHADAMSALQLISTALAKPSFLTSAQNFLFPPPPPTGDEQLVRGTLDWVLFHRRRTRQCEPAPPQPPPPPQVATRRYAVFSAVYGDPVLDDVPDAIAELRDDLPMITEDDADFFKPAGQVEFAGGTATLNTPPADILAAWQATQPGHTLFYGVICTQGDAVQDGDALAHARLLGVRDAVLPGMTIHNQAEFDTLSTVPPGLDISGADGFILLVTTDETQTTRHGVFNVLRTGELADVIGLVQGGEFEQIFSKPSVTKVGEVKFKQGTAEPVAESLNDVGDAWANQFTKPTALAVVLVKADPQADKDLSEAQAKAINQKLGGTASTVTHAGSPEPLPGGLKAMTFLVADPLPG